MSTSHRVTAAAAATLAFTGALPAQRPPDLPSPMVFVPSDLEVVVPDLPFMVPALDFVLPDLEFVVPDVAFVTPMLAEAAYVLEDAAAFMEPLMWAPRPERPGARWPDVQGTTPPDSLYREARTALNNGNHREAVRLLRQLRSQYPRSEYVADSYYWEAFALHRLGGRDELRQARDLLVQQQRQHPDAATAREARRLQAQVNGMLARLGDAEAAAAVAVAAAPAPMPTVASAAVAPVPGAVPRAPRAQVAEDDDVRVAALNALMHMDPDQAMPILRQVLARRDAESASLRRRAVWIVARQEGGEREAILLNAAASDPDREVREQAVYWLSTVKTERAVAALDSILRMSSDNEIREKAVYALSRQDSPRAEQTLRTFVVQRDAPEDVRKQTIFWLSRRGGSDNQAFLRQLFGQLESRELKEQVIYVLGRSDEAANGEWVLQIALDAGQPVELRKTALHWAGRRDDVSMTDLGRLYDTMPDMEIKKQLVYVFARRDERAAVDKLMAIAESDPEPELRKQAIFWLGRSKDPRVPEFLMKLISP